MNWIKRIIKVGEKIKRVIKSRPTAGDIASSLWNNCPACSKLTLKEEIKKNYFICECGYHFDAPPEEHFTKLFDGDYEIIDVPSYIDPDPLRFVYDGIKYIDKIKNYRKKSGLKTSLHAAYGKIDSISAVVVASDFKFGGGAWNPQTSEYFLESCQKAIDKKVDLFLTIFQTGGVAVTTGVNGLTSCMLKSTIGLSEVKKNNIVTIAIASSKTTGGPYASAFFNHHICGVESSISTDILFAGKRVSANAGTTELPPDFGTSSGVYKSGLVDFVLNNRHEIKNTVTVLTRILKKKNLETTINTSEETSAEQSSKQILPTTSKAI